MRITIRGVKWWLRESTKKMQSCWGWCDIDKATITLCRSLRGRKRLDILVHELLHAEFPDLDESVVKQAGTDIANVLWKQGYRREGA